MSCKSSSESKALDILQQHASHYKSKSPTVRIGEALALPSFVRSPAAGGWDAGPVSTPQNCRAVSFSWAKLEGGASSP